MNKEQKRGIGFLELLALLFIALRLLEQIHWDWIWILSPLWIPLAIALAILSIAYIADKVRDKAPKNRFQ